MTADGFEAILGGFIAVLIFIAGHILTDWVKEFFLWKHQKQATRLLSNSIQGNSLKA